MTRQQPVNLAASVHQRLLNLARARGEELQLLVTRYGIERLLYRLTRIPAADRFVLKGAVLFYLWDGVPSRPTRDVDFLAYGDTSPEALDAVFRELCMADVEPDGLVFQVDTVRADQIRTEQEYGGVRITLTAMLGTARIPLQIDVGVGDAVTPVPEIASFPTLLDFPAPQVRAYPAEAVIAEKFHAMVVLGMANTRMKDFYDVWILSNGRDFEGQVLAQAIAATFARRSTALPTGRPPALDEMFSGNREKQAQWAAFARRSRLENTVPELNTVTERIAELVLPPIAAIQRKVAFANQWRSTGWA